jgi:ABC-2 type transport system permease protein
VRRLLAQAAFDARVLLRNGEQVLLTLVLPALLLVGLVVTDVPDLGPGPRVDVVAPGVLALAVLSTAFTQAIGTAFDRRYGVLRLLGTTPLGRPGCWPAGCWPCWLSSSCSWWCSGDRARARLAAAPGRAGGGTARDLLRTARLRGLGLLLAGTCAARPSSRVANLVWVVLAAARRRGRARGRGSTHAALARACPSGALGDACGRRSPSGMSTSTAVAVLGLWAAGGSAAARSLPLGLSRPGSRRKKVAADASTGTLRSESGVSTTRRVTSVTAQAWQRCRAAAPIPRGRARRRARGLGWAAARAASARADGAAVGGGGGGRSWGRPCEA